MTDKTIQFNSYLINLRCPKRTGSLVFKMTKNFFVLSRKRNYDKTTKVMQFVHFKSIFYCVSNWFSSEKITLRYNEYFSIMYSSIRFLRGKSRFIYHFYFRWNRISYLEKFSWFENSFGMTSPPSWDFWGDVICVLPQFNQTNIWVLDTW